MAIVCFSGRIYAFDPTMIEWKRRCCGKGGNYHTSVIENRKRARIETLKHTIDQSTYQINSLKFIINDATLELSKYEKQTPQPPQEDNFGISLNAHEEEEEEAIVFFDVPKEGDDGYDYLNDDNVFPIF